MLVNSAFTCLMPSWISYFNSRTFYVAVKALCLMHRWPKKVGFWTGQVYISHQWLLVLKDSLVPSRGRHRCISMLINSPQNSEKCLCPNTCHRHSCVRGIDHGMEFLFVFVDVGSKNLCLGYLTSIQHVGCGTSTWAILALGKLLREYVPVWCMSVPVRGGLEQRMGKRNKYLFPVF